MQNNATKTISNSQQTYNRQPKMSSSNGNLVVTHREFVNSIDVANSLLEARMLLTYRDVAPFRYSINPGDGSTFPWLSGIASRFEKFRFRNLNISYKPSCPTTTQGGIAIAAVYDPADTIPSNRASLFNAESCVRASVYDELSLQIKKNRLAGERHIRHTHHGLVDANELRSSDPGYFIVATVNQPSGTASTTQYGDLFVEYTIELIGPKVGGSHGKSSLLNFEVDATMGSGEYFPFHDPNGSVEWFPEHGTHHHKASTLKTTVSYANHQTHGLPLLNEVSPTRLKFEEPFQGIMTFFEEKAPGETWDLDPVVNAYTSYDANAPQRAQVEMLTEQAGAFHNTYSVKANAGDVIDLSAKSGGSTATSWQGIVRLLFTEAAPLLLDAAIATLL